MKTTTLVLVLIATVLITVQTAKSQPVWINWNVVPEEIQRQWIAIQSDPGWVLLAYKPGLCLGSVPCVSLLYHNALSKEMAMILTTLPKDSLDRNHSVLMGLAWKKHKGKEQVWLNLTA